MTEIFQKFYEEFFFAVNVVSLSFLVLVLFTRRMKNQSSNVRYQGDTSRILETFGKLTILRRIERRKRNVTFQIVARPIKQEGLSSEPVLPVESDSAFRIFPNRMRANKGYRMKVLNGHRLPLRLKSEVIRRV